MRYHYTAIEWPKSGTPTTTNADKGLEQQEISFIAGGNAKQLRLIWKTGSFLQN